MDRHVSVDIDLISTITRFLIAAVDPTSIIAGKEQDPILDSRMREKYNLTRDKRGFSIGSINDTVVWFAAKVLSSKLLKKMRWN